MTYFLHVAVFKCEGAVLNVCCGCRCIVQVTALVRGHFQVRIPSSSKPVRGINCLDISIDNWQFQSCCLHLLALFWSHLIASLMIVQWGGSAQACTSEKALAIRPVIQKPFWFELFNWQLAIGTCKPFVYQDCWWKAGSQGETNVHHSCLELKCWTASIGNCKICSVENLPSTGHFCALIMLRSLNDVAGQQPNHGQEAQCVHASICILAASLILITITYHEPIINHQLSSPPFNEIWYVLLYDDVSLKLVIIIRLNHHETFVNQTLHHQPHSWTVMSYSISINCQHHQLNDEIWDNYVVENPWTIPMNRRQPFTNCHLPSSSSINNAIVDNICGKNHQDVLLLNRSSNCWCGGGNVPDG